MTKEEILKKSRMENKGMDEREKEIHAKTGHTAGVVSLLLGCLIAIINVIAGGPEIVDEVLSAVYFCYMAVEWGMRARLLNKKSDWFLCALSALVSIFNTLSFIIAVLC
jgi:hypothetical protein